MGYKDFGWTFDAEPVEPKRGRRAKSLGTPLATGVMRIGRDSYSFDDFLREQQVRITNLLHPAIQDFGAELAYEHGIHPHARMNENLSYGAIHRLCDVEVRGNVSGRSGVRTDQKEIGNNG